MKNSAAIIETCRQITGEANSIRQYTESLADLGNSEVEKAGSVISLFDDIRLDELEHIQKLTLQLTELMDEAEPAQPEEKPTEGTGGAENE